MQDQLTEVESIEKKELLSQFQETVLVDVRSWRERLHGHFENDYHIDLNDISITEHLFSKSIQIVTYCNTGIRAKMACQILNDLGFKSKALVGGYQKKPTVHE